MDEIIKLAPIVVAAGSLCLNIYLGWLLRNRPTKLARNEEIRTKLYEMKHKFEETSLIKVAPHYELWEYGFERLEELREGSSRCHVLLESVPEGQIRCSTTL
jgi:hypothetical protein